MTSNQLRQNIGIGPQYFSWSNDKKSVNNCRHAKLCLYMSPSKQPAMINVLCALHMGHGDTNNDSSEMSSEVADFCGNISRIFKTSYKATAKQAFINPNLQKSSNWKDKYNKIGLHGFAAAGTIIKPGEVICVLMDSATGKLSYYSYTGDTLGRVKNSNIEYTGNIGIVTICIEYTKTFKGGDKIYMPNACKSVIRVVPANLCYRTSNGRVIGICYSSLSVFKRFNFVPNMCANNGIYPLLSCVKVKGEIFFF